MVHKTNSLQNILYFGKKTWFFSTSLHFNLRIQLIQSIQKEYLVSNLSVGKEGIIVRAVGTDEEIKREKHAVRAGMEEVYLYHMTSEAKGEKEK